MMLRDYHGTLSGLDAVVIGRSNIVGKPMAQLLLGDSCTVTIAHSRTKDLQSVVKRADIVVAAVGRANMVPGDWIKEGATVIDVGINRIPKPEGGTRLVGDCDYDSCADVAGAITPVPGGVGPMTIACLLANTLTAACRANGSSITLAATNSVASLWIMPQLNNFQAINPYLNIAIVSSDDDEECLAESNDLVILRGNGDWPNFNSELLFGETIFPVCSPDFLAANSDVTSRRRLPME